MSDDAEQFFNAWVGVFGNSRAKKVLCSWHVDRAWRKSLQELIPVQTERIEIYHHLRTPLQCTTISVFQVLLQNFISWLLEKGYNEFCTYFQAHYCNREGEWAFCYRVGTPFNTNMFIESFHRLLKVVYLDNEKNRRIDSLLNTLLRIARDKAYERLIKVEKGKHTHRICEISKRHKAAESLLNDPNYRLPIQDITNDSAESWRVYGSNMQDQYTVMKVKESCDCELLCKPCNTCSHMYKCTCIDDLIHSTVCKHVHVVQMTFEEKMKSINQQNDGVKERNENLISEEDGLLNNKDYFVQTLGREIPDTKEHDQRVVDITQKMDSLIKELQTLNEACTSVEAIRSSMVHVRAAIPLMKGIEKQDSKSQKLLQRKRYAPNSNNEKQLRFYSTKKRRVTKSRWAKPTADEVSKCKETLMDVSEIQVCGICYKEEDNTFSQIVDWLQCDECSLWFHRHCTKELLDSDTYTCQYCI